MGLDVAAVPHKAGGVAAAAQYLAECAKNNSAARIAA
jgi:hypothetical protein